MKLEQQYVERFLERFANRLDVWYKQLPAGAYVAQKPGALLYEPVTVSLIERHLAGELTCGFAALNEDRPVQMGCVGLRYRQHLSEISLMRQLRNYRSRS